MKCPECGEEVTVAKAGKCQGCRAADTFRANPGMAGVILDFWARTDSFPESDSWAEELADV